MNDFPYIWFWRVRLGDRKGTRCRVVCRATTMNSALIEFEDGFRACVSRNALQKAAA